MTRTYGKLQLGHKYWTISAEPNVITRVKRMFPRAQQARKDVRLVNTDEICRDLVWLLERYPMEVSAADHKYLTQGAEAFDARAQMVHQLFSGELKPREFELAIPPREYQRVAADMALRMRSLLIADSVGLGKTGTYICTLTDPSTRPALVVTLTHLPMQWEREIKRFAPGLTTHILKSGTPYDFEMPDVVITNYHKLNGWMNHLAGKMKSIVFDECQELRHSGSKKYDAALTIREHADYCVGLSATPIFNYGGEFFNVLNVLRPDALGSKEEFLREWCTNYVMNDGRARIKDTEAFGAFVREQGLMIRRTRKDVGRELPPLTKVIEYVESDEKALEDIGGSVTELAKFLLSKQGTTFDRMRAGGELDWKMRQATGIAKAPYVAEFVKLLVESGEKVLLFGWHHAVYDIWSAKLEKAGYKVVKYTGEQSTTQKEAARDAFVNGDANVMIMSLRSGAGLDGLQRVCSTVVFGELDWSPGVLEQCTGRVLRDDQDTPCAAYYLLSNDGSDPIISDTLGLKQEQLDGVIDPNRDIVTALEVPEHGIQKLAEAVLRAKGIPLPKVESENE